jgi:hypothetical protein
MLRDLHDARERADFNPEQSAAIEILIRGASAKRKPK